MFNKIASWVIWAGFAVVVTLFIFQQTDGVQSAAAMDGVKQLAAKVPALHFGMSSPEQKLNSARAEFSQGNNDQAAKLYNEYIGTNPKSADAIGELGNVYFRSGRLPEAAQAYYEAANLLLDQHQLDRVDKLVHVIARIRPMLADELARKLDNAMGAYEVGVPTTIGTMLQKPRQSALTRY